MVHDNGSIMVASSPSSNLIGYGRGYLGHIQSEKKVLQTRVSDYTTLEKVHIPELKSKLIAACASSTLHLHST